MKIAACLGAPPFSRRSEAPSNPKSTTANCHHVGMKLFVQVPSTDLMVLMSMVFTSVKGASGCPGLHFSKHVTPNSYICQVLGQVSFLNGVLRDLEYKMRI